MRDYKLETEKRVAFIRKVVAQAGADGVVYGNSGGKDGALCGILCKLACDNTTGVVMPCESKRNFTTDAEDAHALGRQYNIEQLTADLTAAKAALTAAYGAFSLTPQASQNMNPRLRIITLYALAQSTNRLVAGTGNRSEAYVGYFTKWGDGACDFNPIADLTVTEIYEFLRHLNAPEWIFTKAPSAGLYEGQTDEADLGFSYAELDRYLLSGEGEPAVIESIERLHRQTAHKRDPILKYGADI